MDAQEAIDIARQAVYVTLLLGAPVLIAGLVVGLLVGLFQSLTQMHDQTVLFVAKLVAAVLAISLSLPWLMEKLTDYSRGVIQDIPRSIEHQDR